MNDKLQKVINTHLEETASEMRCTHRDLIAAASELVKVAKTVKAQLESGGLTDTEAVDQAVRKLKAHSQANDMLWREYRTLQQLNERNNDE